MQMVELGRTGLRVSRLGHGGAEFHRHEHLNNAEYVGAVLETLLDEGVTSSTRPSATTGTKRS
jgi:aryl-alcohol dehydrogenase-like predicted oxidoreductase